MNPRAYFLLYQICRFGGLPVSDLLKICDQIYKKTYLYTRIKKFMKADLVISLGNPYSHARVISPTNLAYKTILNNEDTQKSKSKINQLKHLREVAQVLLDFGRYSNITGIATEHELSSECIKKFAYGREPDGIIEVTKGSLKFELAVEVETSMKDYKRIKEILNAYEKTLYKNFICQGVIFVCDSDIIYKAYKKHIKTLPEEVTNRIVLIRRSETLNLKPEIYGEITDSPMKVLRKMRSDSTGKIEYSPIISEELDNHKGIGLDFKSQKV